MADLYLGKIPIIRRSLDEGWLRGVGEASFGCVPRDYNVDPVEMGDSPDGMQLLSDADCDAYYEDQQAQQSSLIHQYLGDVNNPKVAFVNLDQGPNGYCWAYSTAQAIMLDRMRRNLPPVRLSGAATAAIIKGGRDEGGWEGLSAKWARENGYAIEGTGPGEWPAYSRNLKYDTPELRAEMATHKVAEDWYDLGRKEWDQHLSKQQIKTLGVTNTPMMWDFNRFSHSMAGIGVVKVGTVWCPVVLNSWKNFGYHGLAVLFDMWPDNAGAIRLTSPSVN